MSKRLISKLSLLGLFLSVLSFSANGQSSYQMHTGFDILAGDDATSPRFRVVSSYRFNQQFLVGLGTGFTYYDDPLSLLPVFAHLKYNLTHTNLAPFLFLNTGYNFSILTDTDTKVGSHRGGWMLNPGIGLRFNPKSGHGWHLNVGYNIDHSQFERQGWRNRTNQTDITYKRLTAGFGLSF